MSSDQNAHKVPVFINGKFLDLQTPSAAIITRSVIREDNIIHIKCYKREVAYKVAEGHIMHIFFYTGDNDLYDVNERFQIKPKEMA